MIGSRPQLRKQPSSGLGLKRVLQEGVPRTEPSAERRANNLDLKRCGFRFLVWLVGGEPTMPWVLIRLAVACPQGGVGSAGGTRAPQNEEANHSERLRGSQRKTTVRAPYCDTCTPT